MNLKDKTMAIRGACIVYGVWDVRGLYWRLSCWFSFVWPFVWIYVCLGDQRCVDHVPIACKENWYL